MLVIVIFSLLPSNSATKAFLRFNAIILQRSPYFL